MSIKIDTSSDEFRCVKILALEGKSIRSIARSTHLAYETCRRWVALIEDEKTGAANIKPEPEGERDPYWYWARAMNAVRRDQQCSQN